MPNTDVALPTLQSIAETLSKGSHNAQSVKLGDAPKADVATDALSAAMSVLTDTLADLADACDGAAAKVRDSHESFAQTDENNRRRVQPGR